MGKGTQKGRGASRRGIRGRLPLTRARATARATRVHSNRTVSWQRKRLLSIKSGENGGRQYWQPLHRRSRGSKDAGRAQGEKNTLTAVLFTHVAKLVKGCTDGEGLVAIRRVHNRRRIIFSPKTMSRRNSRRLNSRSSYATLRRRRLPG